MPRGLVRYQKSGQFHFLTFSCYRRLPLLGSDQAYGVHTQGDTVEELRAMVKGAVRCYFDETMEAPRIVRLHFVPDEVLA